MTPIHGCFLSSWVSVLRRHSEIFTSWLRRLKTFINEILGPHDDIVRFEYIKKTNIDSGSVLIGVELEKSSSSISLEDKLTNNGFNYLKLNDNNTLYNYLI